MRCYLNKDSPIPRRNSTRPNRLLYSTSGPEDKENVPIRKTGKTRLEDNENMGENAEITYNKDTTLDTLNPGEWELGGGGVYNDGNMCNGKNQYRKVRIVTSVTSICLLKS